MSEYELARDAYLDTPSFGNDLFVPHQLWYQYRGFESFWAILKSDSFWATDARFSNDAEEQRFGANIMTHLLSYPLGRTVKQFKENYNEDYIVCFCAEDDKLSQWRGYAPNGGVSIGFDFSDAIPFHIPLTGEKLKPDMPTSAYQSTYVYVGRVCYLDPREVDQKEEEYYQKCADKINYPAGIDKIKGKESNEELMRRAPFIKHSGFREENEYRLVFRNEDERLSTCVHYREPDENGLRRPYIVVRPGDPAYNKRECVVRLCLKMKTQELLNLLKAELASTIIDDCRRMGPIGDKTDDFCFGCIRRCRINGSSVKELCRYNLPTDSTFEWGLQDEENSVIISQGSNQEEIFKKVRAITKAFDPNISVWCEGHLPIRSITVGPCTRQEEMAEIITHYCQHIYWLRDVKIKTSNIPFRRAM